MTTREVLLGPAALANGGEDHVLDLGPHHPSSHGGLRLSVGLDPDAPTGGRIGAAVVHIGYLHRGVEKLFEARDYRQVLSLADRHDWISSFGSELGAALVVERMLGIEVPQRAAWLRTLLAELTRLTHHLAFLGHLPGFVDAEVLAYRERLLALGEALTGGRMHPMFARIGGVAEDVGLGWLSALTLEMGALADVGRRLDATLASPELLARTQGVGVLGAQKAAVYGVSGPVGRASGLRLDERLASGYDRYPQLAEHGLLRLRTSMAGDTLARLRQLRVEIDDSAAMISHCAAVLEGSHTSGAAMNVRLPKVVRPGEGLGYLRTENPSGSHGYLLVSRGEKTPWRLKVRTPGFAHAAALEHLLVGTEVDQLELIIASLCLTIGDIDR